MSHRIPSDPSWCSRCIAAGSPCEDHAAGPYTGPDVYEPSSWVLEVVGGRYRSWDGVYRCFGYDPREGFWMECVLGEYVGRRTNVSERAINVNFHRVTMTAGARVLLGLYGTFGRTPTTEEIAAAGAHVEYAPRTLRDLGLIDDAGLTDAGRTALAELESSTSKGGQS